MERRDAAEAPGLPVSENRWARRLSAVIFYALLALLPLSAAPYASVEPWWGAFFNALVFLLAALWAVEGALAGRWFSRAHLLVVPPLLLAAFTLLQSAPLPGLGTISFDPYESRLAAARLAAFAACAALLIRHTDTERRLRALVLTLILVGTASALFGIARQAAQREELGFLLLLLRRGVGYAQFINRNSFAFLAEMAFGLAAGVAVWGGAGRERSLVYVAAALPLWASLVLSNSRGGLFAMLCQVIVLAAVFVAMRFGRGARGAARGGSGLGRIMHSWAARVAAAALIFCVVAVGAVWLGGDPLADRVEIIGGEVGAGQGDPARVARADIWKDTWRLASHYPLAGVGVGGYAVAIRGYHRASGVLAPQQAHNDYLELAASGGVVGVALLLLFAALLFRRARARLRVGTPFARAAACGAVVGVIGVAAHSAVDFGLHVTGNALFFAALLAVATAETRPGTQAVDQKTNLSGY
jgi:O-antigen ligase